MSYKLINDVIHGNIEFSNFESSLMRHTLINRLHKILQDSTAFMVYPCNSTSRFEHSLGVMHCASDMLINAVANADMICSTEFFIEIHNWIVKQLSQKKPLSKFNQILQSSMKPKLIERGIVQIRNTLNINDLDSENISRKMFEDRRFIDHLYSLLGIEFCDRHMVCLFSGNYCSEHSPYYKKTFLIVLQAIRIYGFLHDVGHLPFSHMFESALGNLVFEDGKESINDNLNSIQKIFEQTEKDLHEEIGYRIMDFILEEAIRNALDQYQKNNKDTDSLFKGHVLSIIQLVLYEILNNKENNLFVTLHSLVDGSMDADRIDFSIRQLFNSGLNTGTSDITRVIKMLRLSKESKSNKYFITPSIQSIYDLEAILKDRFNLYKSIVNHHAVRRTDCILQSAIEKTVLLENEDKQSKSEFGFVVSTMADVLLTIESILDNENDYKRKYSSMYKYSQINDQWLMSKLNQIFVHNLLNESEEEQKNDQLYLYLTELFHNSRVFKSMWKRPDDYREFLENLGKNVFIEELDKNQLPLDPPGDAECLQIGKDTMKKMIDISQDASMSFRTLQKMLNATQSGYLVIPVKLKSGIKDIMVFNKNTPDILYEFNQVSMLSQALTLETEKYIDFYVYYHEPQDTDATGNAINNLDKKTRSDFIIKCIKDVISKRTQ